MERTQGKVTTEKTQHNLPHAQTKEFPMLKTA